MIEDESGKKTERTFTLVEDAEYLDRAGDVATIDIFRSGDEVLVVEAQGQLTALKKGSPQQKTGSRAERTATIPVRSKNVPILEPERLSISPRRASGGDCFLMPENRAINGAYRLRTAALAGRHIPTGRRQ